MQIPDHVSIWWTTESIVSTPNQMLTYLNCTIDLFFKKKKSLPKNIIRHKRTKQKKSFKYHTEPFAFDLVHM